MLLQKIALIFFAVSASANTSLSSQPVNTATPTPSPIVVEEPIDAVPVPQPEPTETRIEPYSGNRAITHGIMRFGIELEQVFRISLSSPKPIVRILLHYILQCKEVVGEEYNSNSYNERSKVRKIYLDHRKALMMTIASLWNSWEPETDTDFAKYLQRRGVKGNGFTKFNLADKTPHTPQSRMLNYNPDMKNSWIMVDDASLTYDMNIKNPSFAIEINSPILEIGASDKYYYTARYHIEAMYYFLQHHLRLELVPTSTASTHVHVSPDVEKMVWTKERILGVAVSSLYFESAIRAFLPQSRWVNSHAVEYQDWDYKDHWNVAGYADKSGNSNRRGNLFKVMKKIEGAVSIRALKIIMNPTKTRHGFNYNAVDRYFGWNFENLQSGDETKHEKMVDDIKGSIEFRRGGQSMSADEAMLYIELVTSFALAGMAHGDARYIATNFDVQPKDLKAFIYHNWPSPNIVPDRKSQNSLGKYTRTKFTPGTKLDVAHAYDKSFVYPELEKAFHKLRNFDVNAVVLDYDKKKRVFIDEEFFRSAYRPPNTTPEQPRVNTAARDFEESMQQDDDTPVAFRMRLGVPMLSITNAQNNNQDGNNRQEETGNNGIELRNDLGVD